MHTVPRLTDTFQPSHYDLSLKLNRVGRSFDGSVRITGKAAVDTQVVFLHAKDLQIKSVSLGGKLVSHDHADDMLTIHAPLSAGDDAVLELSFSGAITDGMHGIYPCYYEHDGHKKELLATQFESHHAREVFPCIDEPAGKATFDVTLSTEAGVEVLGNMPVKSQKETSEGTETVFETSPRMSPYLLAFVVGELQKKSARTQNGTEVNIWATYAQSADSLDFGLDVAVRSIDFFNEYFGTPYPLPKCDHVALPDFSSGAMENWGLITYREICLLADANTAVSTKQFAATVIAHETSHQWFGNLVTMEWWDDLWLNESFATLMEYVCVDELFPEWNIWMTYATNEVLSALRRDYLPGIQAVKTEVKHPDEISTLFDPSIVYAKGARLLAMLREYAGDDVFRAALTTYFSRHAYQNTVGSDLWHALSEKTGLEISAFMKPWLEQTGMPIVHVAGKGELLHLEQQRFLIPADSSSKPELWPVPIQTGSGYELMETTEKDMMAPLPLNSGNTVHAVYSYDSLGLASIITKLSKGELRPVDRLSLLHDASLTARGGYQSTTAVLELLGAYQNETEEPVWDIIGLIYGDLKRFVEQDPAAEASLKARIAAHASERYGALGFEKRHGESEFDTKLRATIVGLLIYTEHRPVIDQALEAFRNTPNLADLDGEMRALICTAAVRHGSDDDVERIIAVHHGTQLAELKQDMCAALCGTKDLQLIQRLLGFLTDETIVRPQDVDRWFVYLIRSRYARELTWQWMTEKWSWIEDTFKSDKSYDSFPRYAASALSTREWLTRFTTFFGPMKNQTALARAISLGISDIEGRVQWLERDGESVTRALTS